MEEPLLLELAPEQLKKDCWYLVMMNQSILLVMMGLAIQASPAIRTCPLLRMKLIVSIVSMMVSLMVSLMVTYCASFSIVGVSMSGTQDSDNESSYQVVDTEIRVKMKLLGNWFASIDAARIVQDDWSRYGRKSRHYILKNWEHGKGAQFLLFNKES